MQSFDFQGALAAGATPQGITNYLDSQGMGSLASVYFNQQSPKQPEGFQEGVNALKGFVQSVASPITTAAGTAIRTIQSTPEIVKSALAGSKNGVLNDPQDATKANEIMAKPILGQNTVEGNTNEQNLGQALKGASLAVPGLAPENAIGLAGTATEGGVIGATQNAGQAMTQNASASDVSKAGLQGFGAGASIGLGGAAVGELADTAKQIPGAIKDSVGDIKNPFLKNPEQTSAAEVLKNPHSVDEQEQAASQGRVQMQNGKKVVLSSKSDLAMQKVIQPLIDSGKISVDKELGTGLIKGDTQIKNIAAINDEVTKIGNDTKSALQDSKATWNQNELKDVANKTEIPDPVKNETALAKNAASARDALAKIGTDIPKNAEGSQQVLQKFDDYLNKNYPKLFSQGRNASPLNQYLYGLRDSLNDWSASKLPEGNLPSGESYRDARLRQYNLLNAKDEMTAKLTNEYPEEMGKFQRVMKAHPALRMGARIIGRQLLRVPITMGEGEVGITQLERAMAKAK